MEQKFCKNVQKSSNRQYVTPCKLIKDNIQTVICSFHAFLTRRVVRFCIKTIHFRVLITSVNSHKDVRFYKDILRSYILISADHHSEDWNNADMLVFSFFNRNS